MSAATNLYKKVLNQPELAQVSFRAAVLEPYLTRSGCRVSRTNTVGRVKTPTWTVDFGIAPGEATIHVPVATLQQRLPESERDHWLAHVDDSSFSENFLKMQASPHACIDDGDFRNWGEEPLL